MEKKIIIISGLHRCGSKFLMHNLLKENKNTTIIHAVAGRNDLKKYRQSHPKAYIIHLVREFHEHKSSLKTLLKHNPELLDQLLEELIKSSYLLAHYYKQDGVIDKIMDMEELKKYPNFKKNQSTVDKVWLDIPEEEKIKELQGIKAYNEK